mmetsp:Transcript_25460/g.64748  ORF Transcript_25460/g.64748 Transcript_25460/m.64748 type:complete len:401 (-) Transcript_25460:1043-2245(-)
MVFPSRVEPSPSMAMRRSPPTDDSQLLIGVTQVSTVATSTGALATAGVTSMPWLCRLSRICRSWSSDASTTSASAACKPEMTVMAVVDTDCRRRRRATEVVVAVGIDDVAPLPPDVTTLTATVPPFEPWALVMAIKACASVTSAEKEYWMVTWYVMDWMSTSARMTDTASTTASTYACWSKSLVCEMVMYATNFVRVTRAGVLVLVIVVVVVVVSSGVVVVVEFVVVVAVKVVEVEVVTVVVEEVDVSVVEVEVIVVLVVVFVLVLVVVDVVVVVEVSVEVDVVVVVVVKVEVVVVVVLKVVVVVVVMVFVVVETVIVVVVVDEIVLVVDVVVMLEVLVVVVLIVVEVVVMVAVVVVVVVRVAVVDVVVRVVEVDVEVVVIRSHAPPCQVQGSGHVTSEV